MTLEIQLAGQLPFFFFPCPTLVHNRDKNRRLAVPIASLFPCGCDKRMSQPVLRIRGESLRGTRARGQGTRDGHSRLPSRL